eukprot:CAMPEP_0173080146 /NCGR_PEP_ID=MMETSP1102-20130122/15929_1 /TAXON_ID=49646 /ORGANISM="Geminigera sp., Strain Caron Lab Isolate" /LENGTH=49 /DNA_ID=CAMNT_0013953331 /DNA_START=402 /DNA_END=551 /DNA_ORIENTATION=+
MTLTSSSLLVCLPTGWCGDGACELKVEPRKERFLHDDAVTHEYTVSRLK